MIVNDLRGGLRLKLRINKTDIGQLKIKFFKEKSQASYSPVIYSMSQNYYCATYYHSQQSHFSSDTYLSRGQ